MMSYLEELLPEFRKGAKIRRSNWPEGHCVKLDTSKKFTVDNNGKIYTIYAEELLADNWEFYQEPIDWDYIIKNKCLCCFSNDDNSANYFGYLKGREEYDNCFIDNKLNRWKYCRSVHRDEVTFYEDKKDE